MRLGGAQFGIDSETVSDQAIWNKSRYRDVIEAYSKVLSPSRIFVADLEDLRDGKQGLQKLLDFLGLEMPEKDILLPKSNVSGRRLAVPRWVNVLKHSPIGDFVRDVLPTKSIQRLKSGFSAPQPSLEQDLSQFSREALQERFPERCAELDDQYRWVRERFMEIGSRHGNYEDSASCRDGLSDQEHSERRCESAGA